MAEVVCFIAAAVLLKSCQQQLSPASAAAAASACLSCTIHTSLLPCPPFLLQLRDLLTRLGPTFIKAGQVRCACCALRCAVLCSTVPASHRCLQMPAPLQPCFTRSMDKLCNLHAILSLACALPCTGAGQPA